MTCMREKILGDGSIFPFHGFEDLFEDVGVDPFILFTQIGDDFFLGESSPAMEIN